MFKFLILLVVCLIVAQADNRCTLREADRGDCYKLLLRWYYNSQYKKCYGFPYTGCGGSLNNFKTKAECDTACPPGKRTRIDKMFRKSGY